MQHTLEESEEDREFQVENLPETDDLRDCSTQKIMLTWISEKQRIEDLIDQ
jgi:hypothetical protein